MLSPIYSVCGEVCKCRVSHMSGAIGKNYGNGLYSQNVIIVSTIMIDTQMQQRYPISKNKAGGVRSHGVTCVRHS